MKDSRKENYGLEIIETLSKELSKEFGKGFDKVNLYYYLRFFKAYPNIFYTASKQSFVSWSHYRLLLAIDDLEASQWYESEAIRCAWSVRTLQRNIETQYYYRIIASQIKEPVEEEMVAALWKMIVGFVSGLCFDENRFCCVLLRCAQLESPYSPSRFLIRLMIARSPKLQEIMPCGEAWPSRSPSWMLGLFLYGFQACPPLDGRWRFQKRTAFIPIWRNRAFSLFSLCRPVYRMYPLIRK